MDLLPTQLYRLYLIWNNNHFIIIPFILSYLSSACALIGGIRALATSTSDTSVYSLQLRQWTIGFNGTTLITNFMCTSLIAGRIWVVHRKTSFLGPVGGSSLLTPMVVIIESGAIYTAFIALSLGLFLSGQFAYFIFFNSTPIIIAIAFLLLIVRLGSGVSVSGTHGLSKSQSLVHGQTFASSLIITAPERSISTHACPCGRGMALRHLEVCESDSHGPDRSNISVGPGKGTVEPFVPGGDDTASRHSCDV